MKAQAGTPAAAAVNVPGRKRLKQMRDSSPSSSSAQRPLERRGSRAEGGATSVPRRTKETARWARSIFVLLEVADTISLEAQVGIWGVVGPRIAWWGDM